MTHDPTGTSQGGLTSPLGRQWAESWSTSLTSDSELADLARLAGLVCQADRALVLVRVGGKLAPRASIGFVTEAELDETIVFAERVAEVGVCLTEARPARVGVADEAPPVLLYAAGVPVHGAEGASLGALCVFDVPAPSFTDEVRHGLESLGRHCATLLELRRSLRHERETDERIGLIFKSATDYAIMSLDADGLVTSWNAGATLIFGWADNEIIGQPVSTLFIPSDRELGLPARDLALALEQGRAIDERYYERKNGSKFWGTGETMPLRASDGIIRGYLKILRDRTTQKRIKEALEYQTGVLQAITDHLGEALFQVDVDHRVTFMNPAAETMFGWSRYKLLGVNLHDRLHHHPEDGPSYNDECPYVIALKSRAALPHRPDVFVHRDGRLIDVVISFTPIVTNGVVTGAVMTLTDITEQKKTEEALRRTQERYRLVVSASEIMGSWDWDLRAGIIVADAIFAAQCGLDPHAAETGVPAVLVVEKIHADDRDRVLQAIDKSIHARKPFAIEFRFARPDGSVTWISAHARAHYDGQGKPIRYPGISVDITDRKREEERRAALLELEDRLRNEGETAAIVALAGAIVCRLLDVKRVGFCSFDVNADFGTIEHDYTTGGLNTIAGIYRMDDYGIHADDLRNGRIVVLDDVLGGATLGAKTKRWRTAGIAAAVDVPIIAEDRLSAVFFVHDDSPRHWAEDDIAVIRSVADRTWAALERARSAERQKILTRELHHRIKNTMTIIQAIAIQTMRKAPTKEVALAAFEARLMALSAAQDVLTRSSWSSATMSEVAEGALIPHRPQQGDRITLAGPTTKLSPQSALSFALAFHELATNATKYGALSNEEGTISIRWAVKQREGRAMFICVWQEKDGPPVVPPTQVGFGSRLIRAGFARSFKVDIDYAPQGLRTSFEAPLAAL
jgi:PAS domain S-box-containing protein